MGKLIRNGIEYGGGNGTDIFEVTQAENDALEQAGTLVHNALYVITDAPNLNATASDIEYSSGVSVADKLDEIPTVTATTDTANGKRLSGGYTQIGNIVFVDINVELLSSTDYTKALQTGLPTPIDNKNVQIIGNNYDTWDYQPNAVLYGFRLANGGVYHNVNSPMASGTKLHIFGSYITA